MRVKTPVGQLPWWVVVGGNVVFWPTWTFTVGLLAHRAPVERFLADDMLTRPRTFESGGDWYRDRLAINRWKDRLPEAGALFPGGFAKRSLDGGEVAELDAFVVETRRAEHAHWGMAAGVAVTWLWNPWWAAPANFGVAAVSNLPCIAVQRYNRARLTRLLTRLGRVRGQPSGALHPTNDTARTHDDDRL
jgi:glycosyl-4,4'-diaponeurosporenoate acyltransferase